MSRGLYRGVYSSLPDDPDFQRLSPNARLVFYTCRLCAQAGPAAIFRYYPELLIVQTGLKAPQLEAALQELERETWILREGVVLWVRNGLRHDPNVRLANPKHRKGVMRALESLPHLNIVLRFCDYYQIIYPFDSVSHVGSVWPSEKEKEVLQEKEINQEKDSAKKPVVLTDDLFIASLKTNRAYQHLDVDTELGRMDAWLMTRPGRQKTRKFIVNWLNRVDRPVTVNGHDDDDGPGPGMGVLT